MTAQIEVKIERGILPSEIFGSGYGYGYGYGYGSGSGYGYGSGYGSGDGAYWSATISAFASRWPTSQQERLDALRKSGATIAFWRSDKNGRACNGGTNKPVSPGVVETSPGPLVLGQRGVLHATLKPAEWKGDRWWIVALIGDVVGDEEKYGALTREIIGEAL